MSSASVATLSRLAGALLLECGEGDAREFFLVGNTKEPCDFPAHGFERPASLDGEPLAYVPLKVVGSVSAATLPTVALPVATTSEVLAKELATRLLIVRNLSVSDRLWRLVTNPNQVEPPPTDAKVDGAWLVAMPVQVWDIVRDTVLRCV